MTTDLPEPQKQLLREVQLAYQRIYQRAPDPEVAMIDLQEAMKLILAFMYSQLGGEPGKIWELVE